MEDYRVYWEEDSEPKEFQINTNFKYQMSNIIIFEIGDLKFDI